MIPVKKSALLAGATGLVGNELLHDLLESPRYEEVKILVRKPIDVVHPKLKQITADFDQLENYQGYFDVDDVFCCLGTTIKKAGSQEAFKTVDYDYPVKLALMAQTAGVQNFLVISALGANAQSKVFYSRTKGQLEKQLKEINLKALHIFQPSLLLGNRQEFRLGEKVAAVFSPLFSLLMVGKLKKYKPVSARRVALAMYRRAQTELSGPFFYPSDHIIELSKSETETKKA